MAQAETKPTVATAAKSAGVARPETWSPFPSLRAEIGRLFDAVDPPDWAWPAARPWSLGHVGGSAARWPVAPAIDVVEKDGNLEITAELPGMAEEDVEVKVVDNTLVITGEKADETEERKKDYYLSERRYGAFQRSFRLPEGADADKIAARFDKGVLTVTLPVPVAAAETERKIPIKSA